MTSGSGGMAGARERTGGEPSTARASIDLADVLDHRGRGRRAELGELSAGADRVRHLVTRAGRIAEPAEEIRIRRGQEIDRAAFERARLDLEHGHHRGSHAELTQR